METLNSTAKIGVESTPTLNTNNIGSANGRKITLGIGTLNIDTNLLLEDLYRNVFPECKSANRIPGIEKKLDDLKARNVGIVCIQEGRKCNIGKDSTFVSIDSVQPIIKKLTDNNYACQKEHYNNSGDKAFQYITALAKDQFIITSSKRVFLSKNGDKYEQEKTSEEIAKLTKEDQEKYTAEVKKHYFDQVHPRSLFITNATHIETQKPVIVINLHLGVFPESHKSQSIDFIINYVNQLHNENLNSIIIMAGDFNSFADAQGLEQIKMLHDSGFKELSEKIMHPNGEKFVANSSFVAYPYDHAAYSFDKDISSRVSVLKNNTKQHMITTTEEDKTALENIRQEMIDVFNDCSSNAKQLWKKEQNENNTKSLYPLGCQLDHIFIKDNQEIESSNEATIQLMDIQGNIIGNSKEDVLSHIQTSLAARVAPFPTDHQGLVSYIYIK